MIAIRSLAHKIRVRVRLWATTKPGTSNSSPMTWEVYNVGTKNASPVDMERERT